MQNTDKKFYLKADDLKGGSKDPRYVGWGELSYFEKYGKYMPALSRLGGGLPRPAPKRFEIHMPRRDVLVAQLFQKHVKGRNIERMTVMAELVNVRGESLGFEAHSFRNCEILLLNDMLRGDTVFVIGFENHRRRNNWVVE